MNEKQKKIAYGALGIFLFLCIWYAAAKFSKLGQIMPDPVTVFSQFFLAFIEPIGTKTMAMHILTSLRRMIIPYIFGGIAGVLTGVLMGWYKLCDSIFMPYIQMYRPIPPIAWIPLSIRGCRLAHRQRSGHWQYDADHGRHRCDRFDRPADYFDYERSGV